MKAQILKHTGLSEEEFYKKYKNPDAFFKSSAGKAFKAKYGATLKKAQNGLKTGDNNNNGIPDYLEGNDPNNYTGAGNVPQQFGSALQNIPTYGPQNQPAPVNTNQYPAPAVAKPTEFDPNSMFDPSTVSNQWTDKDAGDQITQNQQIMDEQNKAMQESTDKTKAKMDKTPKGFGPGMKMVSGLVKAWKAHRGEREQKRIAQQWEKVSDIALKASKTEDINKRQDISDQQKRLRQAMTPSIVGENLFPVYGVGTNVLTKNGGRMMQSGGEIMNTYAPPPYDIYTDLQYEPLNDANKMKTFEFGGPMAQGGGGWMSMLGNIMGSSGGSSGGGGGWMSMFGKGGGNQGVGTQGIGGGMMGGTGNSGGGGASQQWGGGASKNMPSMTGLSQQASADIANAYGNNSGTMAAGAVTEGLSNIPVYGQAISAIAGPILTTIGGAIANKNIKKAKRAQENTLRNTKNMGMAAQMKLARGNIGSAVTKSGGEMNPQVIKRFGDMDIDHGINWFYSDMDTLRTGGNLRSNKVGGVETVSGGSLEPISYNPYAGPSSEIKGQSHDESNGDHSGVIMRYAQEGGEMTGPPIEAERGEIVRETQGPEGPTATIMGDQTFNKDALKLIPGHEKYVGMKYKNISKKEAEKNLKDNKRLFQLDKTIEDFVPLTPFDKLTMNSYTAERQGVDKRLASSAEFMNDLSILQQTNNEIANDYGMDAGEMTRGRYKKADPRAAVGKNGLIFAQSGATEEKKAPGFQKKGVQKGALPSSDIGYYANDPEWGTMSGYQGKWQPRVYGAFADPNRVTKMLEYLEGYKGEGADALKEQMAKHKNPQDLINFLQTQATNAQIGPIHYGVRDALKATEVPTPAAKTAPVPIGKDEDENYEVTPYKDTGLATILGQAVDWLRPTPGEPLAGEQMAGEMFALSNANVEPVQARFKQSLLDTPYDISYQDKLNENQASFNALQRSVGNNPQALSMLAAQKYQADSAVLAEQFRANQAKKDQVYSGNRDILNRDMDQNLAIADQQYVRQAQARSNTKRDIFDALSSVSDKYLKNRLENRTLQTYANMYKDFGFDKNYAIHKTGAPHQFNIDQVYTTQTGKRITGIPKKDADGNTIDIQLVEIGEDGTITPAKKEDVPASATPPSLATPKTVARNGAIVNAFKSL